MVLFVVAIVAAVLAVVFAVKVVAVLIKVALVVVAILLAIGAWQAYSHRHASIGQPGTGHSGQISSISSATELTTRVGR